MKKTFLFLLSVFLTLNFTAAAYGDLFLVGNACNATKNDGGWTSNPSDDYKMNNNGSGVYTWTGVLHGMGYMDGGNTRFKFLANKPAWDPSLTCLGSSHVLVTPGTAYDLRERPSGDPNDVAFQVAKEGLYAITVNTNTMKMTCTLQTALEPNLDYLFIIGDATTAGWDNGNAIPMIKERPGVFCLKTTLTANKDFKFLNNATKSWGPGVAPAGNNYPEWATVNTDLALKYRYTEHEGANSTDAAYGPTSGAPYDNKFQISTGGTYYIKVDLNTMKMRIQTTPFELVIKKNDEITMSATNYTNGGYGDIIFQSDGSSTGQLNTVSTSLTPTTGKLVKFTRTFSDKKWYAIGFPFPIADIRTNHPSFNYSLKSWNGLEDPYDDGDFWIKTYNGTTDKFSDLTNASTLPAGGYAIQFPTALLGYEITFISAPWASGTLSNNNPFQGATNDYTLTYNPSVANKTVNYNDANIYYYILGINTDPANFGELTSTNGPSKTLAPFEGLVVAKNIPAGSQRSAMNMETITSLPTLNTSGEKVVATEYYNLQGMRIAQPQNNSIYIVKSIYESGKTSVVKQIK